MGGQVEKYVINNMISGMGFSMTVFWSKDVKKKKEGVDVYYMHSTFGDDDESIEPQIICEFSM